MDLVYIVRPGDNEELRYSLRSVVNLPHDNVWIVGHCPGWVRNVRKIELVPRDEKWANIHQNLSAACADDRISDDFVLMNDDQFVVSPLVTLPVYHLGPLSDYIAEMRSRGWSEETNTWFAGVVATYEQVCEWGFPDALCYEGHTPLPFNRHRFGDLLRRTTRHPFLWGCAYSASGGPVGVRGDNVKVADGGAQGLLARLVHGLPFLSTQDEAFAVGAVGEHIRNMFPEPGPYEEAA